ncbi:MAG: hypothetical protein HQL48_08020 [Gammaproteobacteria bacterium]|nr:hypothetical protein [Gammaproteobacteria bacterium]
MQPTWITGEWVLESAYQGIGSDPIASVDDFESSMQTARDHALSELSATIATHIQQETTLTSSTELDRTVAKSLTKSVTDASLQDVEVSRWLNEKSCQIYVQVLIDKTMVAEIQKQKLNETRQKLAKDHYATAQDKEQSLPTRLNAIDYAITLIDQPDFTHPFIDKEELLTQYRKMQQEILQGVGGQQHLIWIGTDVLSRKPHLIQQVKSHFLRDEARQSFLSDEQCKTTGDCLRYAQKVGAETLLIVQLSTALQAKAMGGYTGTLTLTPIRYSVMTETALEQPKPQSAQVISFLKRRIRWQVALDKILNTEPYPELILKETP